MGMISRKKQVIPVDDKLADYLYEHSRAAELPISFDTLGRYADTINVYNKRGEDTLWETAIYPRSEREEIYAALVRIYALLKVEGDMSLVEHLVTDRVDVCTWGNTKPFRIRIVNTLNENFDYFYVKKADASRIYGLELEHMLSPNVMEFVWTGETLVEEHVAGIPGDDFIGRWLSDSHLDEIRLAKEFVKFNERCLVRLLGDMHSGNWVVDITPDFDETNYRIRAIDFDQQSYEGRCRVYLPQYYRENNPVVYLGMRCMSPETMRQYRYEERALIARRANAGGKRLESLLAAMREHPLAPSDNLIQLRQELAAHYEDRRYLRCESMGELVEHSLALVDSRHLPKP